MIEGVPATIESSPAIGLFLQKAERPPFRATATAVLSVPDLGEYLNHSAYQLHDGPIVTCRWDETDQSLVQVGELIDAVEEVPQAVAVTETEGTIEVNASTRSTHHIVLSTDGIGVGKSIELKIDFSNGTSHSVQLLAERGYATLPRRVLFTRLFNWFIQGGRITRLHYKVEDGGPAVTSIAFELPMDPLEWQKPAQGDSIGLIDEAPIFEFTAPKTCNLFALELREKGKWRFFFRRDQCQVTSSGSLVWRLGDPGIDLPGSPSLPWKTIVPALRTHLQTQGQGRLNMWARMFGYEGSPVNPVTTSSTLRFLFTP